jgi:hypothetical protein
MVMVERICVHETCTCAARDDGYCSDYCATHGSHEGHQPHKCDCGHPGCNAPTKAEGRHCIADFAPAGRVTGA